VRKKIISVLLGLVLLPPLLLFGILATEQGTGWLATAVQRWSGGVLYWDRLQGRLLGELELSGLRIRLPSFSLELERLNLAWEPRALLQRRLQIDHLQAADGQLLLQPETGQTESRVSWPPQLPELDLPLDLQLGQLRLTDFEVRTGDAPPQRFALIELAGGVEAERISLQGLQVQTSEGQLRARGSVGLRPPLLVDIELHWNWRLPERPRAGGILRVQGDGRLLTLEHHGSGGLPVELRGQIRQLLEHPSWDLALSWPEMPLTAGEHPLMLAAGGLHSDGDPADYRIDSEGGLRSGELEWYRWRLQGQGDAGRLQIGTLEIAAPPLQLRLAGELDWRDGLQFDLGYKASGQGLQTLQPQLPDRLQAEGLLRGRLLGERLQLEQISLGIGSGAQLSLAGELDLADPDDPAFGGSLDWRELGWPLQGSQPLVISRNGRLELNGRASDYAVELTADLAGDRLPAGEWRLRATGDRSRLALQQLSGDLLGGALQGSGMLQWQPALAGRVELNAEGLRLAALLAAWPEQARLDGLLQLELAGDRLRIERGSLRIPQSNSSIELVADAELTPELQPLGIEARIDWSGLRWPLLDAPPQLESAQGSLQLQGPAGQYQFNLTTSLAGDAIPSGEWRATGTGTLSGLQLAALQAKLLGGELQVSGPLTWTPVPAWELRISAAGIDPAPLVPAAAGAVTAELQTRGSLPAEGGVEAGLQLASLQGRYAGLPFELSGAATLHGEQLELERLRLASGANEVTAAGTLSPGQLTLNWKLQAAGLDGLLAGAGGRLLGDGSLSGSPQRPLVRARLQGQELRLDGSSLDRLNLELQAGMQAADPLELELTLQDLRDGEQPLLRRASLRGQGTVSSQSLVFELEGAAERLQARLQGGLDAGAPAWVGHLQSLSAESERLGDWALERAVPVRLSGSDLQLGEACLRAAQGDGFLCAGGDWNAVAGGSLNARLGALRLERWLPDVSGELQGELSGRLQADGALAGQASVRLSPGRVRARLGQEERQLEHGGGRVDLRVGAEGAVAGARFQALQRGRIEADLRLPAANRLPLADPQPLAGRVLIDLQDLSGIQGWLPQLSGTQGRLKTDLQLAGDLAQPRIWGELELADAAAEVPLAGLSLREVGLRAYSDAARPGRFNLSGGLVSGEGRLALDGQLDLVPMSLALNLQGADLKVFDTPDARALLTPDLHLAWSDDLLSARGRLLIPEADITPRLGLRPALLTQDPEAERLPGQPVASSADVVIVKGGQPVALPQPVRPPVKLDSQVELALGERVSVRAMGFISRITGAVTFSNRPGDADLIPLANGALRIEEGTFRAFGQDLEIETGQILFPRVPATSPELRITAVRWIKDDPSVSAAGVMISGPASAPVLELFSRPQLDEVEVQSYLLTGHSSRGEQVLGIGTYLNPKLYVGYGHNLLEGTNEFNALYTITPRYGVEAYAGEADTGLNFTLTHER